ncbi:NAD(P)-binding protein [Pholiota conissans]|uniref:NAD(P)-binding protein n=1 Tax=Pholiota conissans TaxID=109636 RepID=A0A9P6D106_9AGAR|nr:NAD(P)-binding protein [Pholiota conissans]
MALPLTPSASVLDLFSLKGQTALVTGASRGIGAACAIALAQAGADLCLVLRPPAPGVKENIKTIDTIRAASPNTKIVVVHCDLGDTEAVKGVFPAALKLVEGGEIHILVNCAGIQRRAPAVVFPESDWDDVSFFSLSFFQSIGFACFVRLWSFFGFRFFLLSFFFSFRFFALFSPVLFSPSADTKAQHPNTLLPSRTPHRRYFSSVNHRLPPEAYPTHSTRNRTLPGVYQLFLAHPISLFPFFRLSVRPSVQPRSSSILIQSIQSRSISPLDLNFIQS